MDLYIYRLMRIGFSELRACTICMKYRREKSLEELDRYISDLECSWEIGSCG